MSLSLIARKSIFCSEVCKAWCCRYLVIEKDKIDNDDTKFFKLRNIKIEGNKLYVPCRCNWLTKRNQCKLYPWRPLACTNYECEELKKISKDTIVT